MEYISTILYLLSSVLSISAEEFELTITEQFNMGNYGNMFDVTSIDKEISIDNLRFAFNGCTSDTYDFYFYKKKDFGSLVGSETDSNEWEVACQGTTKCTWDQSVFPGSWYGETGDCGVTIPSGKTQALYIYSTQRGLISYKASGEAADEWTRDDHVIVSMGKSGYSPFKMYSSYVTVTTAQLLYSVDEGTPLPTAQPTAAIPTQSTVKCCTNRKGYPKKSAWCSRFDSKKKCATKSDTCAWKKSKKCSNTPSPTPWPTQSPVIAPQDEYELMITEKFNTGNYGNMFDASAIDKDIIITNLRFAFNGCVDSSYDFYFYKKKDFGSLVGSETDSTEWELACQGTTACTWDQSVFPGSWYGETGDCDITIPKGETQALYIYSTQRGLLCYKTGGERGDEWTRDENVIVSLGASGYSPFKMYSSYVTATTAELIYEVDADDADAPVAIHMNVNNGRSLYAYEESGNQFVVYGILACVVFGCLLWWMHRKGPTSKGAEDADTNTPLLLNSTHKVQI